MNEDKFTKAGNSFRNQVARDFSARDQALARLNEIHTICKGGVAAFYQAADIVRPDVFVERPNEQQVNISYGLRHGRSPNVILRGPLGMIFVTPEGNTLLACYMRWKDPNEPSPQVEGVLLAPDNWQDTITEWLAKFLTETERLYNVIRY